MKNYMPWNTWKKPNNSKLQYEHYLLRRSSLSSLKIGWWYIFQIFDRLANHRLGYTNRFNNSG